MITDVPYTKPSGLRVRLHALITRMLLGKPPVPSPRSDLPGDLKSSPRKTTTTGYADVDALLIKMILGGISVNRIKIYGDMEEMESTLEEVSVGLDILSMNACVPPRGEAESFRIEFERGTPQGARDIVEETIKRCRLQEMVGSIVRDTLMYGDSFYQNVITRDLMVSRLMYMEPDTMVRNEGSDGLLMMGTKQLEWAYEQYGKGTTEFLAGFYPWQIMHLRWNKVGSSKYGRPLLYNSRSSWVKLRAMEEAMAINWLTRAFARLLFKIDVTGLSEKEALLKIRMFRRSLGVAKAEMGRGKQAPLTVARDIFLGVSYHELGGKVEGALSNVEVLDTGSSGFAHLDPVKYYRDKIVMGTRVPKAYFGIEEDINAKATLTREDVRFAHTLRVVQALGTRSVVIPCRLSLQMQAFDPDRIKFVVWWRDPTAQDQVEKAQAYYFNARGDEIMLKNGVVDRQWSATHHLDMSTSEWEEVKKRAETDLDAGRIPDVNQDEDEAADNSNGNGDGKGVRVLQTAQGV